MDPATGAFESEYKIPTSNAKPVQLAFGGEGDLWFTQSNNPGAIGGFEPGTVRFAEYRTTAANSNPTGIAAGPGGDLFFTETNAASIGRLNPMTHELIEFSSGLAAANRSRSSPAPMARCTSPTAPARSGA